MSRKNRFIASHLSAALAATSVWLAPTVVLGQGMLEEVVVAVRRRVETLQETPVAVSTFSGENLRELGIDDIADLTKVVPNVDIDTGNGTGDGGNVFIRGIGARNPGVNFDSGVGIYVDGVYVSRADGALLDNVDVQSLQVVRGPQGTLFGKNTTGGAILYSTNKPNEEYGDQVQLRWVASDDLLFDLNYNYGKTDQKSRGQNCEVVTGIPGTGWQSDLQNEVIIVPSTGQTIADWCQASDDLGKDKVMANLLPNVYKAEVNSPALTADWDINDSLHFQSISAWRNADAYTQEFQLAGSAFDEKLDYVVGMYGFHEETDKGAASSPTGPFFNTPSLAPAFNRAFYLSNLTC